MITESVLEPADVIVILGGSFYDRIMEAVDLYRAGFASHILIPRHLPDPFEPKLDLNRVYQLPFFEEHEINLIIAMKWGVPQEAISFYDLRAYSNTYDEAYQVLKVLKTASWIRAIIVTSKSHATRAYWIFQSLRCDHIHFMMKPTKYDRFNPLQWWARRSEIKVVLDEYQKLLHFFLVFLRDRFFNDLKGVC